MAKKKEPTVYELLGQAEAIRNEIYNKVLLLHKISTDDNAVRRIAREIRELCK